eukprot:767371-Hanusia_phi.AAC.2
MTLSVPLRCRPPRCSPVADLSCMLRPPSNCSPCILSASSSMPEPFETLLVEEEEEEEEEPKAATKRLHSAKASTTLGSILSQHSYTSQ